MTADRCTATTATTATLTEHERRMEPAQQRVLCNALQHLASGVPGTRLVLAVER